MKNKAYPKLIISLLLVFCVLSGNAQTWTKKSDVIQYGGADWKNKVVRVNRITLAKAKEIANENAKISYFWIVGEGYINRIKEHINDEISIEIKGITIDGVAKNYKYKVIPLDLD